MNSSSYRAGEAEPAGEEPVAAAFDLPRLLELFDGDRTALSALLQAAIVSIRRDVAAIETGVGANDRAGVNATAHRLTGTSGAIGAERLVAICSRIHRWPMTTPPAAALLDELRAALAAIGGEILAYRTAPD